MSNIAISIGANISNFVTDMNTASNSVVGFDAKTRKLINTMGTYAAAAVAAGAAVVAGLYVTASETIDRQAKLARSLDSSVASIQAVEYAADLAGVVFEELAGSNEKLNRKLGEAITVGGAAAHELDRLGLSAKELSKMDANERLAAIADRLVALNYNSGQAAASLKELGLKGNEMVAMMMDGGQQFRDVNKELRELNVLVSDTDAAKIEAANDAWTKVKTVITGVANTLAVQLAPYVQVVAEYLRNAAVESGGFKEQIGSAIKSGLTGFAKFADVLQGLRVVFKGVELIAVGFGAAVFSVFEGLATLITKFFDGFVIGANLAIAAQNALTGSSKEFLTLPSKSNFMDGLHEAGDKLRDQVTVLREELSAMAMQTMPSAAVEKYLSDVEKKATEAAQAVVDSRKKMIQLPGENEEDKKEKAKTNSLLQGLRAGTAGMQAELDKRDEILKIYRQNTLAADSSYYAQQLNDIAIDEQLKTAEITAAAEQERIRRVEQRAKDLEAVAGDRAAIAAVNAEYDTQAILAEQIAAGELAQVREDAKNSRTALAKQERQILMDIALGLGSQLMSNAQGQSRKLFEIGKAAAIASAGYEGAKSAVSAWRWGMEVGGPWGAAAATAASLLKTGSLIQQIRSTSFGGGGGSSGGGGGGSAPAMNAQPAAAAGGGGGNETTYNFNGLSPDKFYNGAAIIELIKQANKDGALRGHINFIA